MLLYGCGKHEAKPGILKCPICHKERRTVNLTTGAIEIEPIPSTHPLLERRIVDAVTGGEKGEKDCQMGALDPTALWEVGNVAGFGGRKYERYNFAKGYRWSLSYDALQRHLMLFWSGEDRDSESRLYHLAHAAWHCLTLLTFVIRKRGTDDRFPV